MMKMPEPSEFGWIFKPQESAKVSASHLKSGELELTIKHDTLNSVTPPMLHWWFQNFPSLTVKVNGAPFPAYKLWHPTDHVSVEVLKSRSDYRLAAGDTLRICETLQNNPNLQQNHRAHISKLDGNCVVLKTKVFGIHVAEFSHTYEKATGGTSYVSRLVIGARRGPLKPVINKMMVPRSFEGERAAAWLQHNIEEVGFLENFLPRLFERRDTKGPIEFSF